MERGGVGLVLDSKRGSVDFIMDPAARAFRNVNPNAISAVALALAGISGALIYFSYDYWQVLLPLAGFLMLVSGFLDGLDGKVARLTGKGSKRGDFVDHVFDRYADVLMIGAVAVSAWCNTYLGLLAVVGVMLTSYMGTQAQAVGAGRHYGGVLGRADRLVLMILATFLTWILLLFDIRSFTIMSYTITVFEIMMLWFAVVGNLTAIQRAVSTYRSLK